MKQEVTANLYARDAGGLHRVGGGIGLGPVGRQVGAGADDIDRRVGLGQHAALGRPEAGGDADLHLVEALAVEAFAHAPDRRGGDARPHHVAPLIVGAVAAPRARHVAFKHRIRLRRVATLDEAAPTSGHAYRQAALGATSRNAPAAAADTGTPPPETTD